MNTFLRRYFLEPPIAFPLLALFHLVMAIYTGVTAVDPELDGGVWITPLWQVAACIFMLGVTALRKWAAIGYILLAAAGLACQYALPEHTPLWYAGRFAFPVDVIAAALVLFFYKRLR